MGTIKEHKVSGETVSHVRPTSKRHVPFLASLLMAFVVIPLVFIASRGIMLWDPATGQMIAHGWFLTGCITALVAIAVGLFHSKRTNFVIKHVAVTLFLAGLAGDLVTQIGVKHRFFDVLWFFTTLIIWGSWMLYRIDVFRAKATGESGDSWGDVIGLAKSRPKKIRTTESQVIIDVEHGPGETIKDVRRAAEELEDKTGAIVGRTTVTPNERGGGSRIALTMADPFDVWRPYPGPSHPGEVFAMPFRTAYYETGEDQWFGFVTGRRSPLTDFIAPGATFVGLVGTTGAGKSGEQNNIAVETLTRRNVIVVWVDAEKLYQNAGWCLDMLGMAAKNRDQAKKVSRALRKLAEFRVELFGQVSLDAILDLDNPDAIGGREWTDELAEETGEDAVVVVMDEADTFLSKGEWDWLGKRGRSLGIFLVPSVPRASTQEVPAAFRGSIQAWKTFAIGDKYSGEFTLSQEARDGGANPESLRIKGAHYFDLVPGVPKSMWPVLCRSFWSDPGMLRRMVKAAREGRVLAPAGPVVVKDDGKMIAPPLVQVGRCEPFGGGQFTEEAKRWMGEDYEACTPAAVMALRGPGDDDEGPADGDAPGDAPEGSDMERTQRLPADDGGDDEEEDDIDMDPIERTEEGAREPEGDDGVVATLAHPGLPGADESDPRAPWQTTTRGIEVPEEKPPAPSVEEENRDVDHAIIQMMNEGMTEFTPAEFVERLRYAMQPWTVSRRLGGLCETERIIPPGAKLERGRGRYLIVRTGPMPRPSNLPRKG